MSTQSENTGSFWMHLQNEQSLSIIEMFNPNQNKEDVPSMSKLLFDRLEQQIMPLTSVKEENEDQILTGVDTKLLDLTKIQAIFFNMSCVLDSVQKDEIFTQRTLKEFIDQHSTLKFKKFQEKKNAIGFLKDFFEMKVPHDLHLIFSPIWLILMIITSLDLLDVKNASLQSFLDSKIIQDKNKSILNMIALLRKLLAYSKNQVMTTSETVGLQEMNQKILKAIFDNK